MADKARLKLSSQTMSFASASPCNPVDRAIVQHCGLGKVVFMQFVGPGRRPGGTDYWTIERILKLAERLLDRAPDQDTRERLRAAFAQADEAFR